MGTLSSAALSRTLSMASSTCPNFSLLSQILRCWHSWPSSQMPYTMQVGIESLFGAEAFMPGTQAGAPEESKPERLQAPQRGVSRSSHGSPLQWQHAAGVGRQSGHSEMAALPAPSHNCRTQVVEREAGNAAHSNAQAHQPDAMCIICGKRPPCTDSFKNGKLPSKACSACGPAFYTVRNFASNYKAAWRPDRHNLRNDPVAQAIAAQDPQYWQSPPWLEGRRREAVERLLGQGCFARGGVMQLPSAAATASPGAGAGPRFSAERSPAAPCAAAGPAASSRHSAPATRAVTPCKRGRSSLQTLQDNCNALQPDNKPKQETGGRQSLLDLARPYPSPARSTRAKPPAMLVPDFERSNQPYKMRALAAQDSPSPDKPHSVQCGWCGVVMHRASARHSDKAKCQHCQTIQTRMYQRVRGRNLVWDLSAVDAQVRTKHAAFWRSDAWQACDRGSVNALMGENYLEPGVYFPLQSDSSDDDFEPASPSALTQAPADPPLGPTPPAQPAQTTPVATSAQFDDSPWPAHPRPQMLRRIYLCGPKCTCPSCNAVRKSRNAAQTAAAAYVAADDNAAGMHVDAAAPEHAEALGAAPHGSPQGLPPALAAVLSQAEPPVTVPSPLALAQKRAERDTPLRGAARAPAPAPEFDQPELDDGAAALRHKEEIDLAPDVHDGSAPGSPDGLDGAAQLLHASTLLREFDDTAPGSCMPVHVGACSPDAAHL